MQASLLLFAESMARPTTVVARRRRLEESDSTVRRFPSLHGRVAYVDSGHGEPTLIMVHGLPTSKELWVPMLPYLDPEYRVVRLDLNDFGQSEQLMREMTHGERADVLEELREHLRIERFILVGHDLGASVALEYAARHGGERLEKLVLMSASVYPGLHDPFFTRLLRVPGLGAVIVHVMARALVRIGLRRGIVHKNRLSRELLTDFMQPFHHARGRAALRRALSLGPPCLTLDGLSQTLCAVRVPTLVLHGRRDPYVPLEHARGLVRDLPDATMRIIADGAHFLPIDTPEQVARVVREFVGPPPVTFRTTAPQ